MSLQSVGSAAVAATPPSRDVLLGHELLLNCLGRAQRLGFIGEGDVVGHVEHALRFVDAIEEVLSSEAPGGALTPRGADLGSGAGLPGLVEALALPGSSWVLVEAMERRADPLAEAVTRLGLDGRVEVRMARAEDVGRTEGDRGGFDIVTARAFGPPAVVAECAAPLLRIGGFLLVSEPPGSDGGRWPPGPLAELGLEPTGLHDGIMCCRQVAPAPVSAPRRSGLPAKRPLF